MTVEIKTKNTLFTLRYDGSAFDGHSMDADLLANAIAGFSDSLKEADKLINGEQSDLKVNVVAFQDGCFGTVFEIMQSGVNAKDVLEIMGYAAGALTGTGIATGLLDYLRELRNKTIKSVTVANNKATLLLKDGSEIETDPDTAKLLSNNKVREGLNNVFFEPLKQEGADSVTIGSPADGNNAAEMEELITISKEDAELFRKPATVLSADKTQWEEEKDVKFTKIHLTGSSGWAIELPDGTKTAAKMSDDAFLQRCEQSEQKFSRDDTFVVKLKVTRTIQPSGGTKLNHEVLKVLRHRASADRKIL